jgi:DNA primase
MDHVDTIAHPDIKSLYRRDLLDLFGAFAYPPREKTAGGKSWQPRGKRNDKPFQGPLGRPEAGYLKRLAATGNRDQLAAAVLAGLARHPDALADHAEPLLAVSEPGSAFARAIDALIEAIEMLEPGDTLPISARQHLAPLPDNTRYSFLMESTDPVIAKEDLAEAVALLVERPALEAAIAQATQRLEREFDDEAFEEQQRLRKRKLEFDRRLRQMASRRAAAAAQRN